MRCFFFFIPFCGWRYRPCTVVTISGNACDDRESWWKGDFALPLLGGRRRWLACLSFRRGDDAQLGREGTRAKREGKVEGAGHPVMNPLDASDRKSFSGCGSFKSVKLTAELYVFEQCARRKEFRQT